MQPLLRDSSYPLKKRTNNAITTNGHHVGCRKFGLNAYYA